MARRSPENDRQELRDRFPIVEILERRGDAPMWEEMGEDLYRLYYPIGPDGFAVPVAQLRVNRVDLEEAIALDRRVNGATSRDGDPLRAEKVALRAAWAMFELAYAEDMQELDDDGFLSQLGSDTGSNLLGTAWCEERLLRWLEEKDAKKLDALRDALSKLGQVRKGPKVRSLDQRAVARAQEMWPEVEGAVTKFSRLYRGEKLSDYKGAVREDLVERFLPNAPLKDQDACVKRLCNKNAGVLDNATTLVSAATGLTKEQVRQAKQTLDRVHALWPEAEEAVRTFFGEGYQRPPLPEYSAAVRHELVERFLPDAARTVQHTCLMQLCDPKADSLDKAAKLVSAVTGVPEKQVSRLVGIPSPGENVPD